jgi:hypothetical protein
MYKISKVCPFCGHVSEIWVDDEVLKRMEDGERIQDVLPELPASEREVLISGICIDCQEEVFADPDEEEERYAPEPEEPEDLQLELGFDPFEGGYTWDC